MDREALIAAMRAAAATAATPRPVAMGALGTLFVRQVTVGEVDAQTEEDNDPAATKGQRLARGACRVLCDEDGQRLFDSKNAEDVALLASLPWSLLQKALAAADGAGESGNG